MPTDAIIFNRNGMKVAVVSDGKAEIRKVRVTGHPYRRQQGFAPRPTPLSAETGPLPDTVRSLRVGPRPEVSFSSGGTSL